MMPEPNDFSMQEHLLFRLSCFVNFRDGLNTCEIARIHGVPEHVVATQIGRRSGDIDQAIVDTRREME